MKAVVAIDSFKGSLSTFEAAEAVAVGIKRAYPDAVVKGSPLADGGEGTVDAVVAATGGEMQKVTVCGPHSREVVASYGLIKKTETAVMEMAAAAGITMVNGEEKNPLYTTTYGVGEMIRDAINKGCRRFLIGIGGSATNDGGVGMLQALGFEFKDKNGSPISRGAIGLRDLCEIRTDNAMPELAECEFCVACDVKNPLCGDNGCSAIFGHQKGATPEMVTQMDKDLSRYAELTESVIPTADASYPGSGAAGGLGFAFKAYLCAELKPGIDIVIEATELEKYVMEADIVVTGEGRLDGQSCMGKAPVGVATLAKKYNKPVLAFAGCVTDDAIKCNEHGIDAFFPIVRKPCTLDDAMNIENAKKNLADTAEQAFRVVKTFMKI